MQKMLSRLSIITGVVQLIIFCHGCTYDKEALAPQASCLPAADVSFSTDVQPILRASCFSCHGNGSSFGNVSLQTYDDVKALVTDGRLVGSISHSPGFDPMPPGAPKLNECNIDEITTWVQEGAKNN
jgi:hypothetical protein